MELVYQFNRVLRLHSVKWSGKIFLIILPSLIGGCAIVSFREIEQGNNITAHPVLKRHDKESILFVSSGIKFSTDGNLSNISLQNQNYYFEKILIQKLSDAKLFSTVKRSTELRTDDNSLYLHPVYSLTVLLFEDSNYSASFGNYLMRSFSLGFYPQYVEKNLRYEISIENLRTNEKLSLVKPHKIIVSYTAPLLVIPIDINSHPFSIKKQSQMYVDIIYPTLSQLFIVQAGK